jgi:hypothetical protein
MTSMNSHIPDSSDRALDRNSRMTERLGRDGGTIVAGTPPAPDGREDSTIEAFEHEGAGIAAKE